MSLLSVGRLSAESIREVAISIAKIENRSRSDYFFIYVDWKFWCFKKRRQGSTGVSLIKYLVQKWTKSGTGVRIVFVQKTQL